jgi:hypothetical protein
MQPFTGRVPQTCRQLVQVVPKSDGFEQTVLPLTAKPLQQDHRASVSSTLPSGMHVAAAEIGASSRYPASSSC